VTYIVSGELALWGSLDAALMDGPFDDRLDGVSVHSCER
jgi:hypothetical protein